MKLPTSVTIKEVGPRDGLQNEKTVIATPDKIEWINRLSRTGLKHIEVTSFVNPKWIPPLADSFEVAMGIERVEGVTYSALVPNMRGMEGFLKANLDEVAVFMSATETHNQKNINKAIDETFPVLKEVIDEALKNGKRVRGYVSTVFGCPYEGATDVQQALYVSQKLLELGIHELSLGDTIGVANPLQVQRVLEVFLREIPAEQLAMHFHDTRGMALANVVASLQLGLTTFDGALGGLGGCPYAPGASGNVATDDLVHMLHGMNVQTGLDEAALIASAQFMQDKIGRPLPSHTLQTVNAC
ncbi:hydroxymethylglutaryl-CoA lyase [Tumebacillus permanentifrigoris]|uniref:Hydroxymethylglutaryl-CoA lyase n=1 Tax=Tumebacillus permanentifrigoris TaxID=378543 RepID=A0A316D7B1_9BACL|nr:hydroxymethylglutaryl-CoA lyase [Tumebacillus permanentifrigoris]PWK11614.1 hydroxymethylglutaryl-CoA lyase [Tumebacillus permanentifrigoris]